MRLAKWPRTTGLQVPNAVGERIMSKVLHILKSEPDETVAGLIEAQAAEGDVAVVSLYQDEISGTAVNWSRLVEDIFSYDQVICWW